MKSEGFFISLYTIQGAVHGTEGKQRKWRYMHVFRIV